MNRFRVNFRTILVAAIALMGGAVAGTGAPTVIQALFDWLVPRLGSNLEVPDAANPFTAGASALFGLLVGAGLGNVILRSWDRLALSWDRMWPGDKLNLFIGIFAGLLISLPFTTLFTSVLSAGYVALATIGLTVGLAALSVYALHSMGEVLPWNRGRATKRSGIKILDTNIIIDGRILDILRTGFIEGSIYVPGFVLDELQHIADSADTNRRARGRRGLEVLNRLQADFNLEVRVHDRHLAGVKDQVDSKMVRLAKVLGADLVTNDWNLNNVARLEGIRVLNVNDLAVALRPTITPNESLAVSITKEGSQPGQGVGYLDDGTMVVVENGKSHLGETLEVTVTQLIQTERGRMVFAKVP